MAVSTCSSLILVLWLLFNSEALIGDDNGILLSLGGVRKQVVHDKLVHKRGFKCLLRSLLLELIPINIRNNGGIIVIRMIIYYFKLP